MFRSLATSFVFLLAAGLFLFLCRDQGVRTGAGDEPHYLIVADSFAHFDGAKIASAYLSGDLVKSLLSPADLAHSRAQSDAAQGPFADFHAYGGPHGLFSIHNIGLPLLLVPIRWLGGGVLAAKLALLLCSVLLPLLACRAAGLFLRDDRHRLLAGGALCLATPFLIAASQLYPDLLAGILFAFVLLELCARRLGEAGPDRLRTALCAAALALAPWLHLRLAPPTLLCTIGWVLLAAGHERKKLRHLLWAVPPIASLAGLAVYNHYAYGLVGGAYDKSAVEVSPTALMVLFGLQLDQFQGIFVRAPLLLAAVPGVALLARRDWPFALLFLLSYAALVGPNAFHPNWYGGGSFGGRFVLAGGVTLIVPAALALGLLFQRRPRTAMALCFASLLMQLYGWSRFTLGNLPIYNQSADRLLEDYAAPLGHPVWLPAFYRLDVALHHWPNLAWLVALALLLAAGLARRAAPFVWAALGIIAIGGVAGRFEPPLWRIVPPKEIASYAESHPLGMTHVAYGDPTELANAGLLTKQLTMAGLAACVELSGPEDAPATAARICGQESAVSRVALVRADGWHLKRLPMVGGESLIAADFSRVEDSRYLTKGWSQTENWGTWSAAKSAELTFDLDHPPAAGLRLDAETQGFLPMSDSSLDVPIEIDGHRLAVWHFSHKTMSPARRLWIPAELVAGKTRVTLTFRLDDARSPQDLGLSTDTRLLGIGLRRAALFDD